MPIKINLKQSSSFSSFFYVLFIYIYKLLNKITKIIVYKFKILLYHSNILFYPYNKYNKSNQYLKNNNLRTLIRVDSESRGETAPCLASATKRFHHVQFESCFLI